MIPTALREQAPMLAEPSKRIASTPVGTVEALVARDDHYFDIKWDGVRILAYADDGKVWLRNRNGRDVTYRYPEVVAALAGRYTTGSVVLDGEIVAFGADGKPDFQRLSRRDRQATEAGVAKLLGSHPVVFIAFDVLCWEGDDLRDVPLLARKELLTMQGLAELGPHVQCSMLSEDGDTLWAFAQQHQLEGLIAKKRLSTYRAGRSPSWIKIKDTRSVSALAIGYEEGEGSRAGKVGALLLGLFDSDHEVVRIGKVGTGFNGRDLDEVMALLQQKRLFVVEVEYLGVTSDGVLRFPSFKGIRTDVLPVQATVDQLARA